jgi:hypothetical protein
MHFHFFTTILLGAGLASAAYRTTYPSPLNSPDKRQDKDSGSQYTTIDLLLSDIKNITNQTLTLQKAVENINETDLLTAVPVNVASAAVQAAINQSLADAKNLPPQLAAADGISIIMPIQALANASNQTIDAFLMKKSFFVKNNLAPIVLTGLMTQNATSAQFNEEISTRNPKQLSAQSADLSRPIFESLQTALTAFQPNSTCDSIASCRKEAGLDSDESTSGAMKSVGNTAMAVMVAMTVAGFVC